MGRHGRRIQGGLTAGPKRGGRAVADGADGRRFLGAPWRLPSPEPPQFVESARRPGRLSRLFAHPDEDRAAVGPRTVLAITLILAIAAACYLLTATGVLSGG